MPFSLIELETVDSTSSFLKREADKLDGFVFVSALEQTKGKGRENRKWESQKGDGLYFSLLIKDKNILSLGSKLSLASSIFLSDFLAKELGIEGVAIKWPNDVYVNGKKIAGILLEGNLPDCLIIGMGINLNQESFLGEYRVPPTSIFLESQKKWDVNGFSKVFFPYFHSRLSKINEGKIKEGYARYDFLKGKKVALQNQGKEVEGYYQGIDDGCNIIIDGKSYPSGEVSSLSPIK